MIPDHLKTQISDLPRGVGVYLFKDSHGNLLYVGKSKEIRTRVRSYFSGDPAGKDLRLQRMVRDIRSVESMCTSSEFLALLLEDTLIKQGDPVYNLRQNKFRRYIYLTFTDDRYPRLKMVQDDMQTGLAVYGPFPDEFFLPRLESFLGRYYGLRNCHEKNPVSICIQADLGLCLAPCAVPAGAEAYPAAVKRVHDFLAGKDATIITQVKSAMHSAVEQEAFEEASKHRDALQFAQNFIERMKFTRLFIRNSLEVNETEGLSYEFLRGDLKYIKSADPLWDGDQFLLEETPIQDARFLQDRAYIAFRWIRRADIDHLFS